MILPRAWTRFRPVLAHLVAGPLWLGLFRLVPLAAVVGLFVSVLVLPIVLVLRSGWRGIAPASILVGWIPAAWVWSVVVIFLARDGPPILGVAGTVAAWLVAFSVSVLMELALPGRGPVDSDLEGT